MTARFSFASLLVLSSSFACPYAASANEWHDHAVINQAVKAFVEAEGLDQAAIEPIDPRLRLTECGEPLRIVWYGKSRSAVSVECGAIWRVFVPVARTAPQTSKPEAVVSRGQQVRVRAGSSGFSVVRRGIALQEGAAGERIHVRIDDGTRSVSRVSATVGANGELLVASP